MALALGLLGCLALWWAAQHRGRLGPALAAIPRHRIAGWASLALAGLMLLRGNLVMAAPLGLAGLWMLEGPEGIGRRARRLLPARRGPGRARARLVDIAMRPDGRLVGGRVLGGPYAGAQLDGMDERALADLLARCRSADPESAALLEVYLDRRSPGWRVDAQRDRDPRPGGAAKPGAMTQEEAYQILGLERGATAEEVRTAHRTLMKRAHPDQGGSAERAARVNAARDRLVNRHR